MSALQHHMSLFIYLLFVCTIDGRQCGCVQGEMGASGRKSCLVGGWGVFFFFLTKSRNYLKIILKHNFYGDGCPG